jgi:hypothetical protein
VSAIWPFHCEDIHAAGIVVLLLAAILCLDKVWSGKVRLHLRSILPSLSFPRFDALARSSFFRSRIRIRHDHFAALTLAHRLRDLAPTTRVLPTETRLQQHRADRVFTDVGQIIRRFAQSSTQETQ